MKTKAARAGLIVASVIATLLVAAPSGSGASLSGERVCHLDAAEKRKSVRGVHRWTVRQIDRWCVREGRVVSVRQTFEVETGTGWRLESESGTTRMRSDGSAVSRGRFHLSKRNGVSCFPRITGSLQVDGSADYVTDPGC